MSEPVKILIIEDEVPIRKLLRASFDSADTEFIEAASAPEGLRLAAQSHPDLILLDLGLGSDDGLDLIIKIREWSEVPIIVLTARGRENDKVTALDSGADDYVMKPFSVPELMARIRTALRHAAKSKSELLLPFERDGLKVDFESSQVFRDDIEIRLTKIEFRLLSLLARNAGKVLTHKFLIENVWDPSYTDSTHALRVHMGSIRQKIERDSSHPKYIRTETGIGYRLLI